MAKKRKTRKTISLLEAIRRLDMFAQELDKEVLRGLQIRATLEAANDIILRTGNVNVYGAASYNTIRAALVVDLALTLSRALDEGSRRFPRNSRQVASIPMLVHLMAQKRVRNFLVERMRSETKIAMMVASNARSVEKHVASAVQTYRAHRRQWSGRDSQRLLRELRDTRLAHRLFDRPSSGLPSYTQVFALLDVCAAIMEHARFAVLGEAIEYRDFATEDRREADEFWRRALKAAMRGP